MHARAHKTDNALCGGTKQPKPNNSNHIPMACAAHRPNNAPRRDFGCRRDDCDAAQADDMTDNPRDRCHHTYPGIPICMMMMMRRTICSTGTMQENANNMRCYTDMVRHSGEKSGRHAQSKWIFCAWRLVSARVCGFGVREDTRSQ